MQLNPELAARLSSRTGHPIVLGVRPEHLAPESSEHGRLELEVDLVEPMGAETFLYGHTAGHKCACRITLHETKGWKEKGSTSFRIRKVFIFLTPSQETKFPDKEFQESNYRSPSLLSENRHFSSLPERARQWSKLS